MLGKKLELEGLLSFRLLTLLSLIDIFLDTPLQVFSISPVEKNIEQDVILNTCNTNNE